MKEPITLLLISFICFAIFLLFSCSSPKNQGKELGVKYCVCIGDVKSFSEPRQFRQRADSCYSTIKEKWSKYKTDYKYESSKWKEFSESYNKTCEITMKDFNDALNACYLTISQKISKMLKDKLWLKKDDTKSIYLYSFSDRALTMYNCMGKIKFTIVADTLIFEDGALTRAIVNFTDAGQLVLTNPETDRHGTYEIASEKDKLLGDWTVDGGLSVTFYPGGTCSVGNYYTTKNGHYNFKDNFMEIDGPPAAKVSFINPLLFTWGKAKFHRNKRPKQNNMEILFSQNSLKK